ncbi:MAG: hypothetical protein PHY64_03415 [Eubacteriales bacterium]|nr:hypothetical protein [Eubacteriales bacterium]
MMATTENERAGMYRQNPFIFYLWILLYMFIALVMRVIALLPLGALFVFEAGSPWRWLAVLTPVLMLFVILPLRFSFARALARGKGSFSLRNALNLNDYGEKLGESVLHALHIIKWAIPLMLMLTAGYYFYNNVDLITLLNDLSLLGAGAVTVLAWFANIFIGIFGGTQIIPNGDLMEGVYTVLAVYALGFLTLLWGMVRNSAFRYIWAVADAMDKDPHAEARRRLRDRRWKQLGVALVNLILWAPALYVTFTTLRDVLGNLSDAFYTVLSTHTLNLPEFGGAVGPLLFAFFVCYMPLLPLRRIVTAAFAVRPGKGAPTARKAEPVNTLADEVTTSGTPEPLNRDRT